MSEPEYSAYDETVTHIAKVAARIYQVCDRLEERAIVHDASKLNDPEREGYEEVGRTLRNLKFGSPEYNEARKRFDEGVFAHHFSRNSHHPEHYANGINGMSLLDVIEMLCDWKAASERKNVWKTPFADALKINKERFQISDQLYEIIENTARELGFLD